MLAETEKENHRVDGILENFQAGKKLEDRDLDVLANRVRQYIVEMVSVANSGHPGGPLGLADIYTALYFDFLKVDPAKGRSDDSRDRLLISNGHVCAVRYAAMALRGYFKSEELLTFRRLGTRLQGHPSTKFFPEVENSSGSLGQGLANASGLALGLKHRGNQARVFVGMSDGECQEGMTWEAAMAAAHYGLSNLHPFIDWNNIQIDGFVKDVMDVGDLAAKFTSFGWEAKVADGHNMAEIRSAFGWSLQAEKKPRVIVFKTILGKHVSFMENQPDWHGVPPKPEEKEKAIAELKKQVEPLLV